jgi:membrane protein DedA with SNARE-associated domain
VSDLVHEAAQLIEHSVASYGIAALFVIIYLESLGAPLPGESVLVASSLMAQRGDLSLVHVVAAVWTGAVLGDSTGYLIGRFGGRRLLQRFGWVVRLTPERLETLEALFRKRGAVIVFGARFVVLLRQLNGIVAGSVAMPWHKFALANAAGAAAWTAVWTLGPTLFAGLFEGALAR